MNLADPLKVILAAPGLVQGRRRYRQPAVTCNVTRYAGVTLRPEPDLLGLRQLTDTRLKEPSTPAAGLLDRSPARTTDRLKANTSAAASQIALFQIDQENRATEDVGSPSPCPFSPTSRYCSRASARSAPGRRPELSGALSDDWQMMAGYTDVDAKYKHDSNKANEG